MLHCNTLFTYAPYRAGYQGISMSRQLTISSLFSALALVSLCMVTVVGERLDADIAASQALVQAELSPGLPG